jgi:hypothetical protein
VGVGHSNTSHSLPLLWEGCDGMVLGMTAVESASMAVAGTVTASFVSLALWLWWTDGPVFATDHSIVSRDSERDDN